MYYINSHGFCFARCPCLAINVVSVPYHGGFIPDMILLTQCGTLGNPIKCHEEVLSLQHMIQPKGFDIFSPLLAGGCSEGLDAFRYLFKYCLKKNLNAFKPSEHPVPLGKVQYDVSNPSLIRNLGWLEHKLHLAFSRIPK